MGTLIKLRADGRVKRFEARLVARGLTPNKEVFEKPFVPVFRLESLAAENGIRAHLLDATYAFVQSVLGMPNYARILEGLGD